jgi:hypothetical protein
MKHVAHVQTCIVLSQEHIEVLQGREAVRRGNE